MSMMVSFVLSVFPQDILDEILDLIKTVSEVFFLPTLINIKEQDSLKCMWSYISCFCYRLVMLCICPQVS